MVKREEPRTTISLLPKYLLRTHYVWSGLPRWLTGKESAWRCKRHRFNLSGQEESPGGGNDNPLQDSCVQNSMDRGAWWATAHRITKSQIWLSNWLHAHTHTHTRTHTRTHTHAHTHTYTYTRVKCRVLGIESTEWKRHEKPLAWWYLQSSWMETDQK